MQSVNGTESRLSQSCKQTSPLYGDIIFPNDDVPFMNLIWNKSPHRLESIQRRRFFSGHEEPFGKREREQISACADEKRAKRLTRLEEIPAISYRFFSRRSLRNLPLASAPVRRPSNSRSRNGRNAIINKSSKSETNSARNEWTRANGSRSGERQLQIFQLNDQRNWKENGNGKERETVNVPLSISNENCLSHARSAASMHANPSLTTSVLALS